MKRLALPAVLALTLFAETDTRISVNTLVREDVFAGFLGNDMARFTKGEALLGQLDRERPSQRQLVRAWQGSTAYYRAVLAYEAGDATEGDRLYAIALSRYQEAATLAPKDGGVWAVVGATNALFADRLPAEKRTAAWAKSYDLYQNLAAAQMSVVDKLPVHIRGELLAGVTMSAQRTGHQEEYLKSLDKMIEVMAGTPYASTAKAWKERPETVAKSSLLCKNCHDAGRLEARKASLSEPRP